MNKKNLKMLKRHLNMKNELDREIFESVKNGELTFAYTPIR